MPFRNIDFEGTNITVIEGKRHALRYNITLEKVKNNGRQWKSSSFSVELEKQTTCIKAQNW